MPRTIRCRICKARSPSKMFAGRMKWLRGHRKREHPKAFRESTRKMLRTKRK